MHWANKTQTINPIPSSVEIKLLRRAYQAQPTNHRIVSKLIDALVLENKLNAATEFCIQHLKHYKQDDHVYALLIYLYRKKKDIDALIRTGEIALDYSPKIETKLLLAYAYAQQGNEYKALSCIPLNINHSTMSVNHLRLMFNTQLTTQQAGLVCQLYRSLRPEQQGDSGLISYYIKALYQLDQQAEIRSLVNHRTLIREYNLSAFNKHLDINSLNQQLSTYFLSDSASQPKRHFEPGNHTTKCGSQIYFESDWNSSLRELETAIKTAVEHYIDEKATHPSNSSQSFTLNLWANILGQNGHQISHIHPDAIVSGVYYLQVPPSIEESDKLNSHQGYLLFSQPEVDTEHYVKPNTGLIVLFPSYLYHETLPLDYDETRICVAFDVLSAGTLKT